MAENVLEILLRARDDASATLKGAGTTTESLSKSVMALGVAITAAGAAGLKLTADSLKMNAQLGSTGLTIGASSKAMRELALATTDISFPLESVAQTFDLLARAGVTNTEEMTKAAKAFDALGDATGSSADEMAKLLIPAFKLFGEELPTTTAELDRFTFLARNTTVDLQDFGTMLTRMAPVMDELGISMDDAVLTLAALSEKGIQGTAATLALRTAITQAARDGKTLNETLNITEGDLAKVRTRMDDATGSTQRYADAANEQFGVMDQLKQSWSELTLQMGSALEPLQALFVAMTALGPAMLALGPTSKAVSAVVGGLAAIKLAALATWAVILGPVGIIGGIVVGLGAIGVALFQWLQSAKEAEQGFRAMLDESEFALVDKTQSMESEMADMWAKAHSTLRSESQKTAAMISRVLTPSVDDLGDSVDLATGELWRMLDAISSAGRGFAALNRDVDMLMEAGLSLTDAMEVAARLGVRSLNAELETLADSVKNGRDLLESMRDAGLSLGEMLTVLQDQTGGFTAELIKNTEAVLNAQKAIEQELDATKRAAEEKERLFREAEEVAFRAALKGRLLSDPGEVGRQAKAGERVESLFRVLGVEKDPERRQPVEIESLRAAAEIKFPNQFELMTILLEIENAFLELNRANQALARRQFIAAGGQVAEPMQGGGLVRSPTLALLGESGPEAVIPLGRGGQALSPVFNFTFNGPVLANDIEDVVAKAVTRAWRRGGLSFLGR